MTVVEQKWASEAEMCASFADAARSKGWTVYAETGGFDMLLVRDGVQVGIEAKLTAGVPVLAQVIERFTDWKRKGPNVRAVLVPKCSSDFRVVADGLGVMVFLWPVSLVNQRKNRLLSRVETDPHFRKDVIPLSLPPVVPVYGAGEPSPRKISEWRIRALRLCTVLRVGSAGPEEFRTHGMRPSDWVRRGWVERGADGRYTMRGHDGSSRSNFPDVGYEAERDLIVKLEAEAKHG